MTHFAFGICSRRTLFAFAFLARALAFAFAFAVSRFPSVCSLGQINISHRPQHPWAFSSFAASLATLRCDLKSEILYEALK